MTLEQMTQETFNWEIKQGFDGKGKPVFFIYIHDSRRYPGSVTIEEGFRSEAEAVANANCMTNCGERI